MNQSSENQVTKMNQMNQINQITATNDPLFSIVLGKGILLSWQDSCSNFGVRFPAVKSSDNVIQ